MDGYNPLDNSQYLTNPLALNAGSTSDDYTLLAIPPLGLTDPTTNYGQQGYGV